MKNLLVGIVALSAMGSVAASAGTLDFKYQLTPGPIVISADWQASSTPTPINDVTGAFTDVPVTGGIFEFGPSGGPYTMGTFSDVNFYNAGYSGPLGPGGFQASFVGDFGPQVYFGVESAPVFTPGVYNLSVGTLIVTVVPEPATWALLLIGIGGVGASLRRRSRTASPRDCSST